MIRVIARKTIRFMNPNTSLLDPTTGNLKVPKPGDNPITFVDTKGGPTVPGQAPGFGNPQDLPDWVKDPINKRTWDERVKAGDLMEIAQIPNAPVGELSGVQAIADSTKIADAKPYVTDHHVAFLKSRGYTISTVADADAFVLSLSPDNRAAFLADAAAWQPAPPAEDKEDKSQQQAENKAAATVVPISAPKSDEQPS